MVTVGAICADNPADDERHPRSRTGLGPRQSLAGHGAHASVMRLRNLPLRGGLRAVALFEAAKGLLVLGLGFGVLSALGEGAEAAAEELVLGLHLNPASRYPKIFLDAASAASDMQIWMLAALALAYAVLRFSEAYGLWRARAWAEWIAVASGGIYLPVEIYEIARHATWFKFATLFANLAIVVYMAVLLMQRRASRQSTLGV